MQHTVITRTKDVLERRSERGNGIMKDEGTGDNIKYTSRCKKVKEPPQQQNN
jgi:hypothetical protein